MSAQKDRVEGLVLAYRKVYKLKPRPVDGRMLTTNEHKSIDGKK